LPTQRKAEAVATEKQNGVALSTKLVHLMMASYDETCNVSYNKERKEDQHKPKLHTDEKKRNIKSDLHFATVCCNIVL
jgi:hypothetical protein